VAYRLFELLPGKVEPVATRTNYVRLLELLLERTPSPRVLVVGGSILGQGMDALAADPRVELVSTDVSHGQLTAIVSDAHDIPFEDATFDAVIAQAVLEHVADPVRCVDEMHRVLKTHGIIYAETPFMVQVHMGPYDFTRFTHSGHRRLFRHFDEVVSGPLYGPGLALAWSYQYFLLSFATSRVARALLRAFARMTSFYLIYLDRYLIKQPSAYDAAYGFFFMGCKEGRVLNDRELVRYYKGAMFSME
jgi:SAM-dependent methyltransferase